MGMNTRRLLLFATVAAFSTGSIKAQNADDADTPYAPIFKYLEGQWGGQYRIDGLPAWRLEITRTAVLGRQFLEGNGKALDGGQPRLEWHGLVAWDAATKTIVESIVLSSGDQWRYEWTMAQLGKQFVLVGKGTGVGPSGEKLTCDLKFAVKDQDHYTVEATNQKRGEKTVGGYSIAATRQHRTRQATEGSPGPWGRLEYVPLTLDLPSDYVFVPPSNQPPVRWVFHGYTKDKALGFLRSAGLTQQQLDKFQQADWKAEHGSAAVQPGDELILGLSQAARAKIYSLLVEFPENAKQVDPIWFCPGKVDERLKDSGLSTASVDLLKGLLYPQGQSLLLFADFEPAVRRLPEGQERWRFMQATSRKDTLLLRLKIDAETDILEAIHYWSVGGRKKDVAPLLSSLSRVEGGATIDAVCLMPVFIRRHAYTYPFATNEPNAVKEDSFWTAMNTFNEPPDNRLNDMDYLKQVLKKDYYNILVPSQFGDVVFLVTPDDTVFHAAVHVADDIVFTKNGTSYTQPWMFMHLEDVVNTYVVKHPHSGPVKVLYFRRKVG
jgi:hypothetical protein